MSEEAADNQETAAGSGKTNVEALLKAANDASARLAGLHVAFMAVCAYVLTIVFGTTDLDLLMGKGVKLPVVNVVVPIIGFYACAPFIVVLVHFNLLLQLQLLSRKLFAFEAAAPPEEALGGLRDRLHIFPYTYYLVGWPSPLVRPLMGLMVSITVVLLPLITLLALQLWFLAYQSQAVTWCQRLAIWLDIAVIAILWPLIMHPRDDWRGYWRDLLATHVPRRRAWLAFAVLFAGFVLLLFGVSSIAVLAGMVLLLLSALSVTSLRGWQATSGRIKLYLGIFIAAAILSVALGLVGVFLAKEVKSPLVFFLLGPLLLIPLAVLWHPQAPRGSLALLLTLLLGLLLPPALLVDGEGIEKLVVRLQPSPAPASVFPFFRDIEGERWLSATVFANVFLKDKRRLSLDEQVLLAKPPKPETIALIRSGRWQEGLKQVEPLNLQRRNLRHVRMRKAILIGADLRKAQLQGAVLNEAQLQGVKLEDTKLKGAILEYTKLQDAKLSKAELQGAILKIAQLQGADLPEAQLQGADLTSAQLWEANLWEAQLQGARLIFANLNGAKLEYAQLQGADLRSTDLQGATLKGANLQGVDLGQANLRGADLGQAQLQGAHLRSTDLQGAGLELAQLQGTVLREAKLQGADLSGAQLKGADLRGATLYYPSGIPQNTELIDARAQVWAPLDRKTLDELINLKTFRSSTDSRKYFLHRLQKASRKGAPKPRLQSCIAQAGQPLDCAKRYNPQEPQELKDFKRQLHDYLSKLACESPWIARGLLNQILWEEMGLEDLEENGQESSRKGLGDVLKTRLDDKKCEGVQALSQDSKNRLRALK